MKLKIPECKFFVKRTTGKLHGLVSTFDDGMGEV